MEASDNQDAETLKSAPKSPQNASYALRDALAGVFPVIPEEDYSWTIHKLENNFPGLRIKSIQGMHPLQMEGTYNELRIYVRYRWGNFSITMGKDNGENKLPSSDWVYETALSRNDRGEPIESEGYLNTADFYETFKRGFSQLLIGT